MKCLSLTVAFDAKGEPTCLYCGLDPEKANETLRKQPVGAVRTEMIRRPVPFKVVRFAHVKPSEKTLTTEPKATKAKA